VLVAECPCATLRGIVYERVRQFGGPWLKPSVEPALWYTRMRYGMNLYEASPLAALRVSKTPVLLIPGDQDRNPPSHSPQLAAARPANTELWLVRGASHPNASAVAGDEYRRRVLQWFHRQLGVRAFASGAPQQPGSPAHSRRG
jgi:dipeptidyl aminopeptidase/acylaminoacyl peptidase